MPQCALAGPKDRQFVASVPLAQSLQRVPKFPAWIAGVPDRRSAYVTQPFWRQRSTGCIAIVFQPRTRNGNQRGSGAASGGVHRSAGFLRCEGLEDRRLLAGDLNVLALTPTPSGFVVEFNQPVDTSVLNLYDAANGALGPADLSLGRRHDRADCGHRNGRGESFAVRGDRRSLAAGHVHRAVAECRKRAESVGRRRAVGRRVHGHFPAATALPGGDFVFTFNAAPEAVVVGIPDFARGPGQPVNVPAAIDGQTAEHGGCRSTSITRRASPR
jgi:hypothetical protein